MAKDYWFNRTAYGDAYLNLNYVRRWLIEKHQTCNGWGGEGMDLLKGLNAFATSQKAGIQTKTTTVGELVRNAASRF